MDKDPIKEMQVHTKLKKILAKTDSPGFQAGYNAGRRASNQHGLTDIARQIKRLAPEESRD